MHSIKIQKKKLWGGTISLFDPLISLEALLGTPRPNDYPL